MLTAGNVLSQGTVILVTGANGFIASHIIDHALASGYHIRGTVRDEAKGKLLEEYFGKKYGEEKIETVIIKDMLSEGAYDEAVKDVGGIVHCANPMNLGTDPKSVDNVVSSALNILRAASKSSTVRRVVYTSSAAACLMPFTDTDRFIYADTFNEDSIRAVSELTPNADARFVMGHIYAAGKAKTEKACWEFVKNEKPSWELNTVLPDVCFGPWLFKGLAQPTSTVGWIAALISGDTTIMGIIGNQQWFVDVRDTAKLHLIALTHPNVRSERLFGFAAPFNWTDILNILRKTYPDRTFSENPMENEPHSRTQVFCAERAVELLKETGQDGFGSFEKAMKDSVASLL